MFFTPMVRPEYKQEESVTARASMRGWISLHTTGRRPLILGGCHSMRHKEPTQL